MISPPRMVQPPRMAGWLIRLFAPADGSEAIAGDLLEEFASLVEGSGVAVARRWYWRQSLRTVGHLFWAEFGAAPWLILLVVAGGFWSIGWGTRLSTSAVHAYVDGHRMYESHPDAYLFWYKFPLEMGRVILCAGIGSLMALIARRREMAVTIALAFVQLALFVLSAILVIFSGREWVDWFLAMVLWNGLCAMATVASAAFVKMRRTFRRRVALGV